jgi:hypothetical protein
MIQAEKIHFEISRGIYGLISPDHLLKARRLTAVKVSTAYTAIEITRDSQRYPYAKGVKQEVDLKSFKLYIISQQGQPHISRILTMNSHFCSGRISASLTLPEQPMVKNQL